MKSEDNEVATAKDQDECKVPLSKKQKIREFFMKPRHCMSYKSGHAILSLLSYFGILSMLSFMSILSMASANCIGSFLSLNCLFSVLSVNSCFSVLSVGSYASFGSVMSDFSIHSTNSQWSICCVGTSDAKFVYTICDCTTGQPPEPPTQPASTNWMPLCIFQSLFFQFQN